MKKVLKACIMKQILFDKASEYRAHMENLTRKRREYHILEKVTLPDGKIRLLIKEQYNDNELMHAEVRYEKQ